MKTSLLPGKGLIRKQLGKEGDEPGKNQEICIASLSEIVTDRLETCRTAERKARAKKENCTIMRSSVKEEDSRQIEMGQ